MYRLEKAFLKPVDENNLFRNVDIAETPMNTLYQQYQAGYVELSHPSLKNNIFVPFNELFSGKYPVNNLPFDSWLGATIGNKTIYGSTKKPSYKKAGIYFADVFQAGYSVKRVHPRDAFTGNTYPTDELKDVFIQKPLPDYQPLYTRVLTSVNGLLHLNIPGHKGLIIKDAGVSLDYTSDNHLGLISFEKIGEVKQIKPTKEMLSEPDKVHGLSQGLYIDLKTDITNKTVLFSLAGHLFGLDETISVVNTDGVIRLNLQFIDLVDLVMNLKRLTGAECLELDDTSLKYNAVNVEEIATKDEVIIKLLTECMQTFAIVVDCKYLSRQYQTLNSTGLHGLSESFFKPNKPYISDKGLLLPYWLTTHPTYFHDVYKLHVKTNALLKPAYLTSHPDQLLFVNDVPEVTKAETDTGLLLDLIAEEFEVL